MATDRRVSRVAELIKREVSQMLLNGIKDDRVGTGMVSVTDVDVSGDLQHAKIFVSIYGTEEAKAETMAGLKSSTVTRDVILGVQASRCLCAQSGMRVREKEKDLGWRGGGA